MSPLFGPARRSRAAILTALFALLATAQQPGRAAAGVIVDHNASSFDARYDRFASGFPTAPVPNTSPTFTGSGFDLSGVGWFSIGSTFFSVGMVSERHFIAAAHSPPGPGTQINFLDPTTNVIHTYTVQGGQRPVTQFVNSQGQLQTFPSDVFLGTLTAPIPASDHIGFFPVAGGADNSFVGFPTLNYGQNPAYGAGNQLHLGRNNVQLVTTTSFDGPNPVNEATRVFAYDWTPTNPGEFYLIGGDSGAPSLINLGGRLTMLGGHYGVSNVTTMPNPGDQSVDTFLPFYISQLNALMAQDTDATHPNGYSLTVIAVPEPGVLVLTGLAAAVAVCVRRRSRRGADLA
jgi:hypothetical protein